MLLQEIYRDDPWKMLVGCVLLNRTTRRQVDGVRDELFEKWPTPEAMAAAELEELSSVLRPLGLHRRRAAALARLSSAWLAGFDDVSELPGVGKYARDSWAVFQEGRTDVEPEDRALREYLGLERRAR